MTATKIGTERQVAALRPSERPYEVGVTEARGLGVRVFPSGVKSFEFRYVALNGRRRRLPLGTYPGLSLANARETARALRVSVVNGADPAAERVAARSAARSGDTLTELAAAYLSAAERGLHGGRGRPKRASTLAMERTRFNVHIAPRFGVRRFKEIGRADVRGFMRELATERGLAPDTIASIGRTLSAIFAFAMHEERLEANPTLGLTRPLALRSRDRLFSEQAIRALWRALEAVPALPLARPPQKPEARQRAARGKADPSTALAIRFALLTLARRAEVAGARWDEIDAGARLWTVPATRFKGGRAHVVPLSTAAMAILTDARQRQPETCEFVFSSPLDSERPITPHAMARALTRTLAALNLPKGSLHDFRRTGATALTGEGLGFRRFIVSKVLGHSASDGAAVTSVYDRNEYLADKRAALEAWAARVLTLVGAESPAPNVIAIGSARG